MSDAQSAASLHDLFETVVALSQITQGGVKPEFDLSDPFVQGRRGPYVGVAFKMGLVERDVGPGPKRRLTEVGTLALGLVKDAAPEEVRRTWRDRVRRLAADRPEHAAAILPLAGAASGAAAAGEGPEVAPEAFGAAKAADGRMVEAVAEAKPKAKSKTRINLPIYGILDCLEEVRRATHGGEKAVIAKGEYSFARFPSAVLFGILRLGAPDTRVLTERGRVLLNGPSDPGYRRCLERAFEEQLIFVRLREDMAAAASARPDPEKVAKRLRAYRPDLRQNVRLQVARAFVSSLGLLRKDAPGPAAAPAVPAVPAAAAPAAAVANDGPEPRPASDPSSLASLTGPQPLRSFSASVNFLCKMTNNGEFKSFRKSDYARSGMAPKSGGFDSLAAAVLAFGLAGRRAGSGEFVLTELGDQAATLGPNYAKELYEAAPMPRAYREVETLDGVAAKARLIGLGLPAWKADRVLSSYAVDAGLKRQRRARPRTSGLPWYHEDRGQEAPSARPWFTLRACLEKAAAIWGDDEPGPLLTRAEVIGRASSDRTVGYRTLISILEYGLLEEGPPGHFRLAQSALSEGAAALAARPPIFRAVLRKFEAPPGPKQVASAVAAAGFSTSSSKVVAGAFVKTISGLDYAELRRAAGDGGPLAPRFAAARPSEAPWHSRARLRRRRRRPPTAKSPPTARSPFPGPAARAGP